ncbi:MAG TPA: histidine kinase [Actinocrinis sp.]|nr:histidine kinase [Actinocrinis sp.]
MRLHAPRPLPRDAAGAAVLTVLGLAFGVISGWHQARHPASGFQAPTVLGYLLIVVEGVALAWRQRAPNVVLLVVFAAESAFTLSGYPPGLVYLPLIAAFGSAVVYGDRRIAYAVLVAGYLLAARPLVGHTGLAFQVGLASWLAALAAFAEIVRIRRRVRRAEAQEAERAREAAGEAARRRAGEERLRIARDLHDVLAHHLALITVQANAGLVTLGRDAARTEAALRAIKDSGNTALGELRSVLELLRAGQDEAAPRDPTPVLSRADDLARLVDGAKAAGLSVRTQILGAARPLPGPVDRAGYRIAQEALTNAVRHAGPGTGVVVRIRYAEKELRLFVDDDGRGIAMAGAGVAAVAAGSAGVTGPAGMAAVTGPANPPSSSGGGNGLPGMRERVAALGGTVRAEPTARGGFLVEAVLPINQNTDSPEISPAGNGFRATSERAEDTERR